MGRLTFSRLLKWLVERTQVVMGGGGLMLVRRPLLLAVDNVEERVVGTVERNDLAPSRSICNGS